MRNLGLVACALALAACSKKLESKRVDKLDFKSFTIAVPEGWNEVTDQKITKGVPAGAHVLMMTSPPPGFTPSIYIQELALKPEEHQQISGATADYCREAVLKPIAAAEKADAGPARVADFRGFKGCDVEMSDPKDAQSARQIAMTNGTVALSLTCNRDKKGAPEVDTACLAIANAITPK